MEAERSKAVSFALPLVTEEEIAEVVDTLRSDWLTTGPKTAAFEAEFAELVGAPAALALNSGTAALHVALAALGVDEHSAVITTTMTFCSTVHVIEHLRARPILVDVEPTTLNIDPDQIAKAVANAATDGRRIAAVIPVHFAGHPCEMDDIVDLADDHDLAVVEDAAHALPAAYRGLPVGAPGSGRTPRLAAFSFYATKNLTTGEGGMLTGPSEVIDEARVWSLHGMDRDAWRRYEAAGSWFYEVTRPGFKYNMTDMAAALGLRQLRRLDTLDDRRRAIATRYDRGLGDIEAVELPARRDHVRHAWHLYVLRLRPDRLTIGRDQFIEELRARGVQASVHFIPVHLHPYYRDRYGFTPDDFPVALGEFERMLSLPLHLRMTEHDVDHVIDAVADTVRRHAR